MMLELVILRRRSVIGGCWRRWWRGRGCGVVSRVLMMLLLPPLPRLIMPLCYCLSLACLIPRCTLHLHHHFFLGWAVLEWWLCGGGGGGTAEGRITSPPSGGADFEGRRATGGNICWCFHSVATYQHISQPVDVREKCQTVMSTSK